MSYFVSFAYYEKHTPRHQENLRFFLQEGVQRFAASPAASITLTVNGECAVPLPAETERFRVHTRPNAGYDFGAHADALQQLLCQHKVTSFTALPFQAYIFLNTSQRGPFLPAYWDDAVHWGTVFRRGLAQAGIVGASHFFHSVTRRPVVESWAFALRPEVLQLVWAQSNVFIQHPNKESAQAAENRLTDQVVQAGFGYASLLLKFQRNPNQTNRFRIPSRPGDYEGINPSPLEMVFYKTYWDSALTHENGYVCPVEQRYTQWLLGEPECHRKLRAPAATVTTQTETPETLVPQPLPHRSPPPRVATVTVALWTVVLLCAALGWAWALWLRFRVIR